MDKTLIIDPGKTIGLLTLVGGNICTVRDLQYPDDLQYLLDQVNYSDVVYVEDFVPRSQILGRACYPAITVLEMVKYYCPDAKLLQANHKEFGRGLLRKGKSTLWTRLSEHSRDVLGHYIHLQYDLAKTLVNHQFSVLSGDMVTELTFNLVKKSYDERRCYV